MKVENEQLVEQAELEIKRMTDYMNKFTQETEQFKKQL